MLSYNIQSDADLTSLRLQYEQEVARHSANAPKVSFGANAHKYSVRAVPLYTSEGIPANCWGNQRCDNGAIIGKVSEKYGIIQNDDFEHRILNGFEQNGLTPTAFESIVTRMGARAHLCYDFQTEKFDVTHKGDIVALRITAKNSFDGTSRSSVSVGALRLVCLNGMTSFREDVFMSVRHTQSVSADFVNNIIQQAMNEWTHIRQSFQNLATCDISQEQGWNAIENMVNRGILGASLRKQVHEVWEQPSYEEDRSRNLWNLYNAHTQVLTHNHGNHKYEMKQRQGGAVLNTLHTASTSAEFARLLLATPDEVRSN